MPKATSGAGTESNKLVLNGYAYSGVAALVRFPECDAIVVAKNVRVLKKLTAGYYVTRLDLSKTRRVNVTERKCKRGQT